METGLPSGNKTTLFETKCQYLQEADAEANSGDMNTLFIETCNAGDGTYYVIETERFAFDNIEEIVEILNDFIERSK